MAGLCSVLKLLFSLRAEALEEALKEVESSLKLRNLSKTRLLARSESIRAVWISFEVIQNTLADISRSNSFDAKTKTQVVNLIWKLLSTDFVLSLMFMKNVMHRMHQMTETLKSPELNIIDVMTIIQGSVELLKKIRDNHDTMNQEINAGITFLWKVGNNDPEEEFQQEHRMRKAPIRFDSNQETTAKITLYQFYRGEFMKLLNMLIEEYGNNLIRCFETLKPFIVVLRPPLAEPSIENIVKLAKFFPDNIDIDPHEFHVEFSNFVAHIDLLNNTFENMEQITEFSEERKSIFPLTNRCYRLLLTIQVTAAKDERTFSRPKIAKTPLRITMVDKRLESLLPLSCEKDIADSIDIDVISYDWANIKTRRIKFI